MNDWHDWHHQIEKRNYVVKRKKKGITARELLRVVFLLVPIMGTLTFHLWVRSEVTETGYKIQELVKHEESLLKARGKLIVREGVLQSHERINRVALSQLKMEPLRPEQILTTRFQHIAGDRSKMAMTPGNR